MNLVPWEGTVKIGKSRGRSVNQIYILFLRKVQVVLLIFISQMRKSCRNGRVQYCNASYTTREEVYCEAGCGVSRGVCIQARESINGNIFLLTKNKLTSASKN